MTVIAARLAGMYGWEVTHEESSDGSWASYVSGDEMDGHLWQMRSTGTITAATEFYLTDHQGSLRALTDVNGNVVSGSSYDTFGNKSGNIATRFGYTGRERDAETEP